MTSEHVLTLSCPDRPGIVHAVTGFLVDRDANVLTSQQYRDAETGTFFLRLQFDASRDDDTVEVLRRDFATVGDAFGMRWRLVAAATRARVLILVSKAGHCLNDLLYRRRIGALAIDVPAVVSNHPDLADLAASQGIPFEHLPVEPGGKAAQEAELLRLVEAHDVDLVVLARYMQVLSPELCARLGGRMINIHHSFLPSFKGARPYHQAHDRGVKLIGATAHYVTSDLDEGPIIEQDVTRVDHADTAEAMVAAGRDVECVVLARAVRWHTESRVLLNGRRTVVFR